MGRDLKQEPRLEPRSFAAWRRRALGAAGFGEPLAARLAADPRFDLHAVLELVDAGCPPDLAARIVAPLERDGEIGA